MSKRKQLEIDKLERQLEEDIKASAAASAARYKADELDVRAKLKVYETRKALIKAFKARAQAKP